MGTNFKFTPVVYLQWKLLKHICSDDSQFDVSIFLGKMHSKYTCIFYIKYLDQTIRLSKTTNISVTCTLWFGLNHKFAPKSLTETLFLNKEFLNFRIYQLIDILISQQHQRLITCNLAPPIITNYLQSTWHIQQYLHKLCGSHSSSPYVAMQHIN